jgi:hypothetical protein
MTEVRIIEGLLYQAFLLLNFSCTVGGVKEEEARYS